MKKTKSNFRNKVTKDAQRQQKAATSYGHLLLPKGVSTFSPEPGSRVRLDFLPYTVSDAKHPDKDQEAEIATPGTLWWKRPYRLHRNVGASNDSFVCPTSIGKRCPICDYRKKRLGEGAEKEETDAMKASLRNLYIVIPLDSKKHEAEISIFDISQYNFQNLLNEELEDNQDKGIFPDLEEGLTLRVRFDSKTIGSSKPFAEASRIDFEDRKEAYEESILEEVPDLDKVLKILPFDELEAIFFEVDKEEDGGKLKSKDEPEEEEEEEEDTKPVRKHKTLHKEEPEEETEEEEEEEEEKPKLHRKPVKKEEPEEEEEEEEEEEKPKKPMRRNAPASGKPGKEKCPSGHKFGEDAEDYPECDTCDLWSECVEEKENK